MLSLYKLGSASDALKYYQQGDYYTKGGAEEHSLWLGKGAEKFNLSGAVDFKVFKELLEGRLPNGELMSQVKKGAYHRPGYDLTFSAPKSVSILALVAGNEAILQAHREAINETVTEIESKYAACRIKNNGIVSIEKTHNFTVPSFEHSDSRAGDPDLHTHCVLMNVTQDAHGKWRALFADELYSNKVLNGMKYRSKLAHKLMALGFEIEIREKGLFEIKGIDRELIDFYSKRRAEIESWLEENQRSGGKAAEIANFLTRNAKVSSDPEERKERWIEELKSFGSSLEKLGAIIDKAKENGPVAPPEPAVIAHNAITLAVNHLSERQNTFSFQAVIKTAKFMSLLPVNEGDLLNIIEQKIADKSLVYLENKCLTSSETKDLEQKNIDMMQSAKGSVNKVMPKWIASLVASFKTSEIKEQEVLINLLSSNDRQILLSSNSKAMLNKMLKNYIQITSAQQFYPRVLTQNQINVAYLSNNLGTERVSTLEGFLLACEERAQKRGAPKHILENWDRRIKNRVARDIWIVNGDISLRQLNRLSHWAEHLGSRVIFTQLKELLALQPLKDNGLINIRLRATKGDVENLKSQEALIKNISRLEKNNHCQESADYEQRQHVALAQYLPQAENSLLITLSRPEKTVLNSLVRQQLKQRGRLTGQEQLLYALRPLSMSIEEKSQCHLYQPGDIIRFNRELTNTAIVKESYFEVHKVDLEKGAIELRHSGTQLFWQPAKDKAFLKQVEVFKKESREVQQGEVLCWSRTIKHEKNKQLDRIKGQTAVVMQASQNEVSIKLQNGLEINLNAGILKEQHWDYGYAVHLKEANCTSIKEAVIVLHSKQPDAKNISLLSDFFDVAKSAGVKIKIVCNNVEALKKTIAAGGEQPISLENIKEASYKREEALQEYQTLATQPLFNRLQSEFLKVSLLNPELAASKTPSAPSIDILTPELRVACNVVDKVCIHHSERDAVLNLEQLKKDIVQLGALLTPVECLEKAVDLAMEKGWLISAGENEQGEKLVTAKHTLFMEQLCIEKMKAGQNQLTPILDKNSEQILAIQNHSRLTQGQKEAIELIMTTPDRMVAVQGIAGAGKTTALKEINRLCEANHYTMVLANTASAKNQAKNASGIEAKTTAQFLTRMETKIAIDLDQAKKDFGGNRLYIVDESSLASTYDTFRLETVIEKLDARLIWSGDFNQQGSIGAGLSFHDLLAYGINKVVMQENVRLNDPIAFTAMKQAYAGDMKGALKTLKDNIEEIPVKAEALERIATAYVALSPIIPELLVIIPLNKDRNFVNQAIREKLKEHKVLPKQGLTINVFVPTDKREIDKSDIFSYKSRDVIRFNTNHPRLGIKAGDYADILEIDLTHQRLTLKIEDKKEFYWSPKDLAKASGIEIYQKENRELSQNDIIVFKRNQELLGIFNGDKATILKIEAGKADILLTNGNIINLDLTQKQNQHLDHGYALTTYAAQGRDVKFVMGYIEGPKALTKKTAELKIGDIIVLPKEMQPKEFKGEHSKCVKVTQMDDVKLILQDRVGYTYEVKPNEKGVWEYFLPAEQLRANHLPLSTSQQSFIINITRGDGLLLIVPNVDHFQKTLETHHQLKRSALSYTDPEWQKLHEGANRLVANITGKAEEKIKNNAFKLNEKLKDANVQIKQKRWENNTEAFPSNKQSNFIDKDELESRLGRDMLGYASQWLGSPSSVTGKEVRWGNNGSFSLILNGPKAGVWNNWEADKKGKGLISLYMAHYSVKFKDAVQELGRSLGLTPQEKPNNKPLMPLEEKAMKLKQQAAIVQDQEARVQDALSLYHKAVPIKGTLAEKYLKEHRGITGDLPKEFRFLKTDQHFQTKKYLSALVAPYKDKEGNMVGIVRIYLNKDGSKYQDTFKGKNGKQAKAASKANRGVSSYGSVTVQEGIIPRTLWIAEGVETALSVAKAIPNQTVVASLSVQQLSNVPISPETKKVVICADNDPALSNTKESVIKAVESFLSQGVKVSIALPPDLPSDAPEGMKKYDFNDLLKDHGVQSVQKYLAQMVEIKDASLLKKGELKLSNNLNTIRLENEKMSRDPVVNNPRTEREISSTELPKTPVSIQERSLEKEIER
jgi:conjugative relaxase-like TrwC/TraI family protein